MNSFPAEIDSTNESKSSSSAPVAVVVLIVIVILAITLFSLFYCTYYVRKSMKSTNEEENTDANVSMSSPDADYEQHQSEIEETC